MKKVIIFGANGFVGKNLCSKFINSNWKVIMVVSSKEAKEDLTKYFNHKEYEIYVYDEMIKDTNKFKGIDLIVNLAWKNASGEARKDWNQQFQNVILQREILQFCKDINCKQYVGVGSIAEKQIYRSLMGTENISYSNYYALAKYNAHFEANAFCNENKINLLWLQITNTFGTFENSARLVNSIIRAIIKYQKNNEELKYNFSSGSQLYDFVHIDDCVNIIYNMCSTIENGSYTYVISSNNPKPFKWYIQTILETLSCELNKISFNPDSTIDMNMTKDDYINDKLKEMKYQYKWNFKEAILDTYKYILKNEYKE